MDLSRIFKSKTRQALLELYFANLDKTYYLRELERLLDIPVSMIRKELLRLTQDGTFLSERKGSLNYFYVNKSYLFFDELKSIIKKTLGLEVFFREELKNIKGIEYAFIYGSFNKDKIETKNEIKLFIIGKINEDTLGRRLDRIGEKVKRRIIYILYSKDEFIKMKLENDSFIMEFLRNPKIPLLKDNLNSIDYGSVYSREHS